MDKIDIIKTMVENDPSNYSAWYLLGKEYVDSDMMSEALEAFSQALKNADDEMRTKIMDELSKLSSDKKPNEESRLNETKEHMEEDNVTNRDSDSELYVNPTKENIIPLQIIKGGNKNAQVDQQTNVQQVTFEDVGGLDALKETIQMKIIKPFVSPGLFSKFKKKVGGGILLFGPPGCGKTFIARATAGECHARFTTVHITDILDPYLGVSAQNIKDIFAVARAKKPCVLFFDEIDTIGYNRSKLSSEHMRPIVDQLLSEIEGIDSNTDELLIIGATNMPWDVDSAFKRPGRFDKTVFVPPPDQIAREEIFRLKIAGRPVSEDIDFGTLAKQTELYSGADIENIIETATENVISEIMKTDHERPIQMKDLLHAIEQNKPSTVEWLRTIRNYVKYANQAGLYDEVERYLARYKKIL